MLACLGIEARPRAQRGNSDRAATMTEQAVGQRFCCVGCGIAIARTEVAVAVRLSLDALGRPSLLHHVRFGWACTGCSGRPSTPTSRTFLDHGFWWPHEAVDPPSPCEGCGQRVSLRTHHRRTRVLCSNACRVRINPSHRDRVGPAAAVRCQQCGASMRDTRWSRQYCSSACRQRAYRLRAASGSLLPLR